MQTPPTSPDLNLIEHCFSAAKKGVYDWQAPNLTQGNINARIQEEWARMQYRGWPSENMVASMPGRIHAVIQNRGGTINY